MAFMRVSEGAVIAAALAATVATVPSSADFLGLESEVVCRGASDRVTVRVYAVFDNPADEVLSMNFADITTNAPDGFWQSHLTGDTAPIQPLVNLFPEARYDTFVTIGVLVDDGTDSTVLDDNFDLPSPGQIVGAWLNDDPKNPNGQMFPDANGRVVVAQLSFEDDAAHFVDGTALVFWRSGETGGLSGDFADFGGAPEVGCSADYDDDGVVGASDLATLLASWNSHEADLDCDGLVGPTDLATLLAAWGECP